MIALLLLALALSADAFAVAAAAGVASRDGGAPALRLGLAFGVAQGVMPLIGFGLALIGGGWFTAVDHWIAFALLTVIGAQMIRAGLSDGEGKAAIDTRTVGGLMAAALATSIDAAVAGLTLPALGVPIVLSCAAIGVITAIVSAGGARFGGALGLRFGARAEIAGGLVLIAIGVKVLVEHLA